VNEEDLAHWGGGGVVPKKKKKNCGKICGEGGMLFEIINKTQFQGEVGGFSGSAKSGETKPTIIQVEQR